MPRPHLSTDVRLEALRHERRESRERVAADLGVSLDTIRRWEQDGPPRHRLQEVADHFDVSVGYLMGWVEKKAA